MVKKTDLGFYLISDQEYYNLEKPEVDTTYVLVNKTDDEFVVLRNGKFMGKINKKLDDMKFTAAALRDTKSIGKKEEITNLNSLNSKQQKNNNLQANNNITTINNNSKKKKPKFTAVSSSRVNK